MLKLEVNEVATLLAMLNQAQIAGYDVLLIAEIVKKLQKEMEKLAPDTLGK